MLRRPAVAALVLGLSLAACGESKEDNGLEKIAGAQGDLTGDRKQAVQTASQTFKAEVSEVSRELVTSVSLSDGQQQIEAALQGLASSYQAALAPIDCS